MKQKQSKNKESGGVRVRVLITGNQGRIGQEQVRVLLEAGHEVRTLDRGAAKRGEAWEHIPGDLRDLYTVRKAVAGMDAVVHLGAIPDDWKDTPDQVFVVNTQGTWNVLLACTEAGVGRMVNFSSVNALGCVGEHRTIEYLPMNDAHPHHPMTPYQISKHIGEELCAMFSARHGMVTISLRPGWVALPDQYHWFTGRDTDKHVERAAAELWAYVDRRDVCEAARLALTVENVKNDAFLLYAADTDTKISSEELVNRCYPDMPWNQDRAAYFADNPHRGLFDCSHAKEVLGWEAKHSWRDAV